MTEDPPPAVIEDAAPPQTTVVLAVWDDYVGERLTQALASVRGQGVAARIVVVDNASRVNLPVLPGVTVVRARHRVRLGAARNLGLERVRTPYVVSWDADDVMLPGTLAMLEREIGSSSELAAFAAAIVEESGARHRWPRRWVALLIRVPRFFALIDCVWSMYPTTGATIMRTELVRAGGGYATSDSGEDWCLGVSLAFRGRIGWSEQPGRIYRRHEDSMWARHMTARHQLRHARVVRGRIRSDGGIPAWTRALLPLIELGQYVAIAAHLAVAVARRSRVVRLQDGR